MEKEKFYITTTLPYVNASPHIGFATELVRADVVARNQTLIGKEVFFNTGTDEHGQKIYDNAVTAGEEPQTYVNRYTSEFQKLIPLLGIVPKVHFVRTTESHHHVAAQEMWRRCDKNGDIYKSQQVIKYCVGCELEKTDSELIDGRCSIHSNMEIETREEENYFFRFSKYQQPLLELYKTKSDFVLPDFRHHEIIKFVEAGLRDFSISRLKNKMPWGVPVPGDDEHIMFVWFDALTSYISTTGWPEKSDFNGWWPGVQIAGKDNLRQQAAIWQAMLMSAELPNSLQVVIGGFINSGGQKMSKSLGNVISPYELVDKYGTEGTRFQLLRNIHPFQDTDVTWERLDEWYTANLVNGLGNLVARIMQMAETYLNEPEPVQETVFSELYSTLIKERDIKPFRIDQEVDQIAVMDVQRLDERITKEEPYKLIKTNPAQAKKIIQELVTDLYKIGTLLEPYMPLTSEKIKQAVKENKKPENLFPRLIV